MIVCMTMDEWQNQVEMHKQLLIKQNNRCEELQKACVELDRQLQEKDKIINNLKEQQAADAKAVHDKLRTIREASDVKNSVLVPAGVANLLWTLHHNIQDAGPDGGKVTSNAVFELKRCQDTLDAAAIAYVKTHNIEVKHV